MRTGISALAVYLSDHHAGSVGAREILAKAIEHKIPDFDFFATLDREIAEDQRSLETFIERVGAHESFPKKAGAWVGEKLSRLKLGFSTDPLGRFEMLEALLLGVRGKLALWQALDHLPEGTLPLGDLDLPVLIARAENQLERLESRRREAFEQMLEADK